jgi:hypothetical protein
VRERLGGLTDGTNGAPYGSLAVIPQKQPPFDQSMLRGPASGGTTGVIQRQRDGDEHRGDLRASNDLVSLFQSPSRMMAQPIRVHYFGLKKGGPNSVRPFSCPPKKLSQFGRLVGNV